MQVQYLCKLIAFTPKSFVGREGEPVEYNACSFLNEDAEGVREVISINTKQNLGGFVDQEGTLVVDMDITGKKKPSLVSFKPERPA